MAQFVINKNAPVIQNLSLVNKTLKFTSSDSIENYEKNKNKFGDDWYYSKKDIDYVYNSWGYRSKNFNDIHGDYLLTFGCSYTEGIGLNHEDMWSTKLAKRLNYDHLNVAQGGTGNDFILINTILLHNFLTNVSPDKLPKLIVYQWAHENRTSTTLKNDNTKGLSLHPVSASEHQFSENASIQSFLDYYVAGFVGDGGDMYKQMLFSKIICNNLWKSLGIKVLNWEWDGFFLNTLDIANIHFEIIEILNDYDETGINMARDSLHNGHLTQNKICETLLNKLNHV